MLRNAHLSLSRLGVFPCPLSPVFGFQRARCLYALAAYYSVVLGFADFEPAYS